MASAAAKKSAEPDLAQETRQMHDYKAQALKNALSNAKQSGRSEATFTDYLIAAEELGERLGLPAEQWNSRSYSDLSKQTIAHFAINERDMKPPSEILAKQAFTRAAMKLDGGSTAPGTTRLKPTAAMVLRAMQEIQNGETPPGLEQMENFLDLDDDHCISKVYAGVDHEAKFHNTVFEHCSFHPAGTLMHNGQDGLALTDGAKFKHSTFDGLETGEKVVLAAGRYEKVTLINSHGGTLGFASGAIAEGVDLRNGYAALEFAEGSAVRNLNADGAHLISITAAPGVRISHANFNGATIDMASTLAGTKLEDVHFTNANLAHVDMRGATLTKVAFDKSDMKELDLRGATLHNITVDGKPVNDAAALTAMGATTDARTQISASKEFTAQAEVAAIGAALIAAQKTIGTGTPTPPEPTRVTQAASRNTPAPSRDYYSANQGRPNA